MAQTALEIILTESGGDASGGAPPYVRAGGPDERTRGPRADHSYGPGRPGSGSEPGLDISVYSVLKDAVDQLVRAIGLSGGLLSTVVTAAANVAAIWNAATQARSVASATEQPQPSDSRVANETQASEDGKVEAGPTATEDDAVDVEWEDVTPQATKTPGTSLTVPGTAMQAAKPQVPVISTAAKATEAAAEGGEAFEGVNTAATVAARGLSGLAMGAAVTVGALAGVALVTVGVVKALSAMSDSIKQEAQRLEGYSASVANANAQAEVAAMNADMRRAQKVGPELADATRASSQWDTALADLKTDLIEKLLPMATTMLSYGAIGVETLRAMIKHIELIYDRITFDSAEAQRDRRDLNQIQARIEHLMKDEQEDAIEDPITMSFIGMFGGNALGLRRPVAGAAAPPGA